MSLSALGVLFAAFSLAAPGEGSASVGFRIVRISAGPKLAVWYPAEATEAPYSYGRSATGSVALNAAPARRQHYPLILFSHGWEGCGTQSVFLTEQLARAGYVVAAPDHRDAGCSVDGRKLPRIHIPQLAFTTPGRWQETSYDDRRQDLEKTLDWMLQNAEFRSSIDDSLIGAMGHSLGGYSVLGLAGAWKSWKDPRITAVLALSPYVKPFLLHQRLLNVDVPVMYEGARFDWSVTPSLRSSSGAYEQTESPKYYVELPGGSHFAWTNAACFGHRRVEDCLEKRASARLIVDYSVAFFDCYLKGRREGLELLDGAGLRAYWRAQQH